MRPLAHTVLSYCEYNKYMATADSGNRVLVRINDLDWEILGVMEDGRRYTPQHLYADIDELDEHGDDWIRRRVSSLYDEGLIERVGTSSMYEISDWGLAALDLKEQGDADMPPKELAEEVIRSAAQSDTPD